MSHVQVLPRSSLTEKVIGEISRGIASGRYASGERLPTGNALAQEFGVSLTVIREAISALRGDGLVETRQGSGVFVSAVGSRQQPFRIKSSDANSVSKDKIFELRFGIEVTACALAAERRTTDQMAALTSSHERLIEAVTHKDGAVAEDLDFHRQIAIATGNELFVGFTNFIANHIAATIRFAPRGSPGWWGDQLISEHQRIHDAILTQNTLAAHEAMTHHMQACKNRAV